MAYKRKSSGSRFGRTYKRRRTSRIMGRRRMARRTARNKTWTSQSATGNSMQYRARKLTKRTWRRKLWNDTLAVTHFRSSGCSPLTTTTSTAQGDGLVTLYLPTFIGTPGPTTAFWTVTGGLQATDEGAGTVTFDVTDLVIRGGRIGITLTCPDAVTEEIGVTIYVVQLYSNPDYQLLPNIVTWGSMVDSGPDFNRRLGKVLYNKSAILSNAYSSFTLEHRLKIQKIDQETHGTVLGNQIGFIVTATPLQTSPVTGFSLPTIVYHDLSFTGDTD